MTMYWLGVFQFLSNFLSLGSEADYIQLHKYAALALADKSGRSLLIVLYLVSAYKLAKIHLRT